MEHTTLFCSSQTWKGPNVSTFSSEWDDTLNSYLLAPDVIKPPPQFQDPEEPCQATPTNVAVIRRRDKDRTGAMQKERRSRPVSAMEHHRRSLSLSTAITSNAGATRRRCESYALSYPSSSSDDSGSDSTSVRRGERLPDAVPQHKARSIVLRKAKRKPAPPARTVSLPRLTDATPPERRTQSLYIPSDANLLPDLIPLSKEEADDSGRIMLTPEAAVPVNQAVSGHRPLKELRSSEPCRSNMSSSLGNPLNEPAKVPCNSDCNNSPSSSRSSRSSPSQPSISSPTKPPGSASPSSGYSSQCETPTQPTSITTGACRMRPKPSGAAPSQQVRNCRSRLSLQLPETQAVNRNPEPSVVLPKVSRRYSDVSQPKQRLSNSMLIMPVVTQEDLKKVRLRSVSSSDLDSSAVIEEENERDAGSVPAQNSPKNKPPVAPKPPLAKWPPYAAATNSSTTYAVDPTLFSTDYRQSNIYSTVNKVKPRTELPSLSNSSSDHLQQPQEHVKEPSHLHSQCRGDSTHTLSFTPADDAKQKKRRAPAPPVSKRPAAVSFPCEKTSSQQQLPSPPNSSKLESSQREYHVTVYGLIPSYSHLDEKEPEYEFYDKEDVPEIGALHLVSEEDEVFLHKPSSHTTEDLFTIIHRSKRKLLGRKDSLDNKQGDFGTHTLAGVSKSTNQNDNFMALLRRTRSAKAICGSRISAAELLRSSKPTASGSPDLTGFQKHNMMQSHCP